MPELADIRALYEAYIETVTALERERKPFEGLFGMKGGPKDDPCHGRFSEELRTMLEELAAQEPASETLREVLSYIYTCPREHPEPKSAYWMLEAAHGLALPLIERLTPADAEALRARYARDYPRWQRLPVQQQTYAALKARAV